MNRRLLTGKEPISGVAEVCVHDFWRWAYSDIVSNRNRSIFAEYLVALALGTDLSPRVEWDAVDIRYRGSAIEVKSAAYLQGWSQNKPSAIRFDIAPKLGWNSATNELAKQACRAADLYIFCLHGEANVDLANVLDTGQWTFVVVPTCDLNKAFTDQRSLSLNRLLGIAQAVPYAELRTTVDHWLAPPESDG